MDDGYDEPYLDFFRSYPKNDDPLKVPLSDGDIKRFLPNVKIIKYNELDKYNSIQELLPNKYDYVVLLTELKHNVGHWLALLRDDKTIIFFDSYGYRPDKHLLWAPKQLRKSLGQDEPHLSYLLNHALDSGFKVVFDGTAYQNRNDKSIMTCGRHVVNRIRAFIDGYRSPEQYKKYFNAMKKRYNANGDDLVVRLVR